MKINLLKSVGCATILAATAATAFAGQMTNTNITKHYYVVLDSSAVTHNPNAAKDIAAEGNQMFSFGSGATHPYGTAFSENMVDFTLKYSQSDSDLWSMIVPKIGNYSFFKHGNPYACRIGSPSHYNAIFIAYDKNTEEYICTPGNK